MNDKSPKIDGQGYKRWQERGYLDTRDILYIISDCKKTFNRYVYKFYHDSDFHDEVESFADELNAEWKAGAHPYRRLMSHDECETEAYRINGFNVTGFAKSKLA